MNRTVLVALLVSSSLPLAACNNKRKPHDRDGRTTGGTAFLQTGSGTQGNTNPNTNPNTNANPAAPMARVADHGDPTGEEQELIELMQRARRDPVAEAARINASRGTALDFSAYAKRPPLSPNQLLRDAARGHANDMVARAFYGHPNPDGKNANGRIMDTGYPLNDYFGTNPTLNLTENIGKGVGAGNLLATPQGVHDAFLIDANVSGVKHRLMILGDGTAWSRMREVGVGYVHTAPASEHVVEEFAYTRRDAPFVVGVAYDDRDGDGVCRAGEGTPGVTVTLSHASGFSVSTTTMSAGGYSFEVFVPATYTLTIGGQATTVVVNRDNTKVDLRSGAIAN